MQPIREVASAGAAAAVEALQSPSGPRQLLLERLEALQLGAAAYVGLVLATSTCAAPLCSGNLLAASSRAALLAGPTLSDACIAHSKVRVIYDAARASETLEDIRHLVLHSASAAAVGVPLITGGGKGGSVAAPSKPSCSATLLLGFSSAADITAPALKGALLLAHALAEEQQQPMRDVVETVVGLVLPGLAVRAPPPPAPAAHPQPQSPRPSPPDWTGSSDSEEAGSGSSSSSAWEDEPAGGAGDGAGARGGGLPAPPHVSLRGFPSGVQEARFAAYHAAQMLRLDAWAYALAFACFCLEAFCPGTPLRLWRRMGPRCLLGAAAQLPGLLLLSAGTRRWFFAHRDALLALTWLAVAAWQQSLGGSLAPAGPAPTHDPHLLRSFSWLTVMGLAFQMRFRYQGPAAIAAYAANAARLLAACAARPPGHLDSACALGGTLRAGLHGLLLPLACCYVFEKHARRLFLRSAARVHT